MKIYLAIVAILAVIFFQNNKYEANFEKKGLFKNDSIDSKWTRIKKAEYSFHYTVIDTKIKDELTSFVDEGIVQIESFFEKPFNHQFDVHIFPNRNELDKKWQTEWEMPDFKSACWMVASGTASRLDFLSPQAWKDEACEHNYENKVKLEKLIYHELVHVYQGQYNPNPDFEAIDKIGWFVEGLAVYASGQYDAERKIRAKEAYEMDEIPGKLENIWSGNYRYAVAGSLVAYIDLKYGRNITFELISFTSQSQILSALKISEEGLMKEWKNYLSKL